jgi:hypothetical protein
LKCLKDFDYRKNKNKKFFCEYENFTRVVRGETNTIVSPTDTLAWGSAPAKRLCGTLWLTFSHSSQTLVAEVSNDAIATGNSVKI